MHTMTLCSPCIDAWQDLTNTWQLLAHEHIHDAGAAKGCFQDYDPWWRRLYLADDACLSPKGMMLHLLDHALRHCRGDNGYQPAFVRHIERIESQQLARPSHLVAHQDLALLKRHTHPGTHGDFVEGRGHAATRWIAQAVNIGAHCQHVLDQRPQRCCIAAEINLEF